MSESNSVADTKPNDEQAESEELKNSSTSPIPPVDLTETNEKAEIATQMNDAINGEIPQSEIDNEKAIGIDPNTEQTPNGETEPDVDATGQQELLDQSQGEQQGNPTADTSIPVSRPASGGSVGSKQAGDGSRRASGNGDQMTSPAASGNAEADVDANGGGGGAGVSRASGQSPDGNNASRPHSTNGKSPRNSLPSSADDAAAADDSPLDAAVIVEPEADGAADNDAGAESTNELKQEKDAKDGDQAKENVQDIHDNAGTSPREQEQGDAVEGGEIPIINQGDTSVPVDNNEGNIDGQINAGNAEGGEKNPQEDGVPQEDGKTESGTPSLNIIVDGDAIADGDTNVDGEKHQRKSSAASKHQRRPSSGKSPRRHVTSHINPSNNDNEATIQNEDEVNPQSDRSARTANASSKASTRSNVSHLSATSKHEMRTKSPQIIDINKRKELNNMPEPPNIPPEDDTIQKLPCLGSLNMQWVYGMNKATGVISLGNDKRESIFYASAHTAVIYDFKSTPTRQRLLRGHMNNISCICASDDKKWIVTADKGIEHKIIIWDANTGFPVRTFFEPYPGNGIEAVCFTRDAKFLATLSSTGPDFGPQVFDIWEWTKEEEEPLCHQLLQPEGDLPCESFGTQRFISFNQCNSSQIVTNSECQVIFYEWNTDGSLIYYAPLLTDEDFNKPIGKYSQSVFLQTSTRALSATSLGNLVVWATNKPLTEMTDEPTPNKKALKIVKFQDKAINVLTTMDHYLVLGDNLGHVKFLDQDMKLVNWYQDIQQGPIVSVSFTYQREFSYMRVKGMDYPMDSMLSGRPFPMRNFVIGTSTGIHCHVTTNGSNMEIINKDFDNSVQAIAAHPTKPRIALGGASGLLKIWDYEKNEVISSRVFERSAPIQTLCYHPRAFSLAVGFANGKMRIITGLSLQNLHRKPFCYSNNPIYYIAYSHDNQYLATADYSTITFYERDKATDEFEYLGRIRAHYKKIHGILFGVKLDNNQPRFLSISADRFMVEYDLENSTKDNIIVLSTDRLEQSAIPICFDWYPQVGIESFIMTGNDSYKFKLYNGTTKMCRKTVLGPTYGTTTKKIAIIPTDNPTDPIRHMIYSTQKKIGIHRIPMDGNPHNSSAIVAHPSGVSNIAISNCGKYMFSIGGTDCTCFKWEISLDSLDAQIKLGGEGLTPFYNLLPGGRDGIFYKEMEDFFYYSQIRTQGINTKKKRKVSYEIELTEVPYLLRALSYYPTEQEIDDIRNEIKYTPYVKTGKYQTTLNLDDFIKLYINHRPVFGIQPERFEMSFKLLATDASGKQTCPQNTMARSTLLSILQNRGENMTELELAEYLTTLLGYVEEGGSSEKMKFNAAAAQQVVEQGLEPEYTCTQFCEEILGFGKLTGDQRSVNTSILHETSNVDAESLNAAADSFFPDLRMIGTRKDR